MNVVHALQVHLEQTRAIECLHDRNFIDGCV